MTKRYFLPLIVATATVLPTLALAASPEPALPDLDQQVRCAVVFALVSREQKTGQPNANRFPNMDEPGKAFFVATGLRLMSERKMLADDLKPYFMKEVERVQVEMVSAKDPSAAFDGAYSQCLPLFKQVAPEDAPVAN